MSEKTGYHRGSLETLLHEKKELSRLLQIVNSQIERHLQALEEEGFDRNDVMEQITGQKNQSKERDQEEKRKNEGRNEGGTEEDDLLEDSEEFGDRDFSPR